MAYIVVDVYLNCRVRGNITYIQKLLLFFENIDYIRRNSGDIVIKASRRASDLVQ